jgi:hypothetical protein
MDAIWFGVKIGVGIAIAIFAITLLVGRLRWLAACYLDRRFVKAGFSWEENRNVRGWLTRDPNNDDWILWDRGNNRMLRSTDNDNAWTVSPENLEQCLNLGQQYFAWMNRR